MKIFKKLKEEHDLQLSNNRFSLLSREELYSIVRYLRDHTFDDGVSDDYKKLMDYTYRYNSQSTKELALNLYKWCKRYL